MFFDAALTTVNPLGERLFLAVPRVIHPGAGDKPRPNIPTLRRVGTQRPRPHVRGRVLRTLTRMRFAPGRRVRLACRCRFDAVPVTHLHIHTVWGRTDIRHSVPLLHAHLVFVTKYRRPVSHRRDAELLRAHHPRRARCRTGRVQRRGGPHAPTRGLPARAGDLDAGAPPQGPHRLRRTACVHPATASAPTCADTSARRPTSPSLAAAHRCRSSSTLTPRAGQRPAINTIG